jgi:hypothetical protein
MARPAASDDTSLKRLGGGRWQTRDERFTIGPFRSLGDAKDAIGSARTLPPAASPLAERVGRRRAEPEAEDRSPDRLRSGDKPSEPPARAKGAATSRSPHPARPEARTRRPEAKGPEKAQPAETDEEAAEPRWFAALEPDVRRQARRLIARLVAAGASDPEGMARRDIVGDVSAVAAFAIERRLDELGPDADPAAVVAMLIEGRDDDLGARWRVVDEAGRPIRVELDRHRRGPTRGR